MRFIIRNGVSLVWTATLLVHALFAFNCQAGQNSERLYRERTATKQDTFTLSIDHSDKVTVTSRQQNEDTSVICLPEGQTLRWHRKSDDQSDIRANRSGNTIVVKGSKKNRNVDKVLTIDARPWYQLLSFSLRSFLQDSKTKSTSFWMIRPDTLEPVALVAKKTGAETISLPSGTTEAIRILVAPQGWLGNFWHAYYWYRSSDLVFLQYRATHGGPLAPETIITLAD